MNNIEKDLQIDRLVAKLDTIIDDEVRNTTSSAKTIISRMAVAIDKIDKKYN